MSIGGHDSRLSTSENYRAFAREAHGRSPAYESLADSVAGDENVLSFLSSLPRQKRQPNLLFASARYLLNKPPSMSQLRAGGPGRGWACAGHARALDADQ